MDNWYLHWLLPSPAYCSLWSPETRPTHPPSISFRSSPCHIPAAPFQVSLRQRPQSHRRAPVPSVRSCRSHCRTPWLPCVLHRRGGNAMLSHFVSHFITKAAKEQMTHLNPHKNSSLRFACSHYVREEDLRKYLKCAPRCPPWPCLHHPCPHVHVRISWTATCASGAFRPPNHLGMLL